MLLERGMEHGMEAEDMWFDPLFLVIKGMQDKQMQVLECIKMFSDMGLNIYRWSVQQLQRYAETHPSDYGLRYGSYGYDAAV